MSEIVDERDGGALSRCEAVQLAVMEAGGQSDRLPADDRLHLEGCAECSRAAAAEASLAAAFERVRVADDPELAGAILASLPRRRLAWRVLAWLPALVATAVLGAGAALAGGIPGFGPVGLVLVSALAGWPVALAIIARAFAEHLPVVVVLLAIGLAVLAAAGAVAATRRWSRSASWARE